MLGAALFLLSLILLVLFTAAFSGDSLSIMAVRRLAEDEDSGTASRVERFLRAREAYTLTLQTASAAATAGATLLLYVSFRGLGFTYPAWSAFGGCMILAAAVAAIAGLVVSIDPERAFLLSLPVVRLLFIPFGLISIPLGRLMQLRLAAFRAKAGQEDEDKEEEISALISVGRSEGILKGEDSELIRGVMEFGDTVVREVMIPRTDMLCLSSDTPLKNVAERLAETRHTRLPIYEGQVDNVVGIAYLKDFLGDILGGEGDEPIGKHTRPVSFVPENKPISMLLREFQRDKQQMAVVVDEYGGIDGLVTTEDLLEEIVGEIQDYEEQEDEPFREVAPGIFEVLGRARVDDLADLLGVELPEKNYDSVAGWISTSLGVIPKTGSRVHLDGVEVEILSSDKKRIHTVKVKLDNTGKQPSVKENDSGRTGRPF